MPIEAKNVTYTYMPATPFERRAIDGVSLTIDEGSLTAIAGHTGSGKSTLVQLLAGLLTPTLGSILIDGTDLLAAGKKSREARHLVGMVFQYPEQQLFEETVEADIAFGPKNFGMSEDEIKKRVRSAMDFVGMDYEAYRLRSPFELSGGQMRRVAIAGVLSYGPKYLVLDEPTAGLDPAGKDDFLRAITKLRRTQNTTIILVSHNMEDIARLADRVILMKGGRIILDAPPREAFFSEDAMNEAGVEAPGTVALLKELRAAGLDVSPDAFTVDEAAARILKAMGRKRNAL